MKNSNFFENVVYFFRDIKVKNTYTSDSCQNLEARDFVDEYLTLGFLVGLHVVGSHPGGPE